MKKIRYGLIEEKHGDGRTVYGIAVLIDDFQNGKIEMNRIGDITCNREALEALVGDCNSLHLSPIHLNEVIEDFLLR